MAHENSKYTIMKAALRLFMEKGYAGTGVTEIVQRAGITKPVLYYFFRSKEGLFAAILETYYTELLGRITDAAAYEAHPAEYDRDVFPVLCAVAQAYFGFAQEYSDFYLLSLSMTYAHPDAQMTERIKEYQIRERLILKNMFASMSAYHGNMKRKEELLAVNYLALIHSAVGLWHNGHYPLDRQRAEQTVKLFMHGIFS
ncbi:TetR/AcrR family transcriptional regulator [Treponema brennaborense]|uniref:Regulatory protein TetR n=1 Tax=Treponema brennaborense (strain DSM 12168 / CIP 105900 / DD5/3) TaxID=906968 RepID=F4LQ28_TREBD|nr:TetR/AcrR family transcriptional regulator [Treponema brennaborense]AEE17106.1 regulatory protein TetR [Treponema brennaborense DSM 12168]